MKRPKKGPSHIKIEPKDELPVNPDALTVLRHEEGDLRGQIERAVAQTSELRARLKVVSDVLARCDPEYHRRREDMWAHRIMFGIH